jgi:hypothetical protein
MKTWVGATLRTTEQESIAGLSLFLAFIFPHLTKESP